MGDEYFPPIQVNVCVIRLTTSQVFLVFESILQIECAPISMDGCVAAGQINKDQKRSSKIIETVSYAMKMGVKRVLVVYFRS